MFEPTKPNMGNIDLTTKGMQVGIGSGMSVGSNGLNIDLGNGLKLGTDGIGISLGSIDAMRDLTK